MRKLALNALLVGTLVSGIIAADMAKCGGVGVLNGNLTDNKGMTLYIFDKDKPNTSNCLAGDGCLTRWPIFYVEPKEVTCDKYGINGSDFGTITRSDDLKQSTYKGMPLYYWYQDKAAGDVTGDNFKNVWHVIKPGM